MTTDLMTTDLMTTWLTETVLLPRWWVWGSVSLVVVSVVFVWRHLPRSGK